MKNNQITIVGRLAADFTFSHEVYKERFFSCILTVERESGTKDNLPIIISERIIDLKHTYDNPVCIKGQLRSHNKDDGEKRHLILYVFVTTISEEYDICSANEVYLEGTFCKAPTLRMTPSERQVADLMIAVKRAYAKSDYIPCICWGRCAQFVSRLEANEHVQLTGRLQSREYVKSYPDHSETKTAYEVSVSWLECIRGE